MTDRDKVRVFRGSLPSTIEMFLIKFSQCSMGAKKLFACVALLAFIMTPVESSLVATAAAPNHAGAVSDSRAEPGRRSLQRLFSENNTVGSYTRTFLEDIAAEGTGFPPEWSADTLEGPCETGWDSDDAGWPGVQCDAPHGTLGPNGTMGGKITRIELVCDYDDEQLTGDVSGLAAITSLEYMCVRL